MPAVLTNADRERLVKLLGMLGSSFAGERDAAGLAATRFLRERGLTWSDVVLAERIQPTPVNSRQSGDWRDDIGLAVRHLDRLTVWEQSFVINLRRFRHLSPKQAETLHDIARKTRAAAA